MGTVHTEITLKNPKDETRVESGLIKPEEIRTATVSALVDTGAMSLVITEELRQKLGLAIKGERSTLIADGRRIICKKTEGVEIHWKNRDTTLPALVVPGNKKILMGVIPLEAMDLMVNPVSQEVVGVHGDEELILLY